MGLDLDSTGREKKQDENQPGDRKEFDIKTTKLKKNHLKSTYFSKYLVMPS